MPLLGRAALLLAFDIAPDAIDEHDDWHTHEHLPERLSIPGFCRGTRWIASRGNPRYFVMYEVADLAVLTSPPYRERLEHPTPWTSSMMPHYRGMRRGLCAVTGSFGFGLGTAAVVVRFGAEAGRESALRAWLLDDVLRSLPAKPGIGSAHLFESAAAAPMTAEQRIRGVDATFDRVVVVTGYDEDAIAALPREALDEARFTAHGAIPAAITVYRQVYALTGGETPA